MDNLFHILLLLFTQNSGKNSCHLLIAYLLCTAVIVFALFGYDVLHLFVCI